MKTAFIASLAGVGIALSACGDIQDHSATKASSISAGGEYIAGIGDAVLTIENSESLPNAFGGADIFGRTRPTGTTTVYFHGVSNGKAQFVRRDVLIHSEKTTMNSSPTVINPSTQSTFSGNVAGIPYSGTSSTNAYPIILPPNTPQDRVAGVRDLNIEVPIGQQIVVAGSKITITTANAAQVNFTIN